MTIPVWQDEDDEWWFDGIDQYIGPYQTRERAEEKCLSCYDEVCKFLRGEDIDPKA